MPTVAVFIIQNHDVLKKMCGGFVSRYRIEMTVDSLFRDWSNTNLRQKNTFKERKTEEKKNPGNRGLVLKQCVR